MYVPFLDINILAVFECQKAVYIVLFRKNMSALELLLHFMLLLSYIYKINKLVLQTNVVSVTL